jgi:hypothetical protein
MKKNTFITTLLALLLLSLCEIASSQNRWEFPMVFTDKFGVSDTVWFIQREDSKLENNTINVTEERYCLDDEGFQVYFRRTGDTLWKSKTHLFTNDFNNIGVYATQSNFPITISWNRRLFDTIIGDNPPIVRAKIENGYTHSHDLDGNEIFDYYGWYVLGLDTTGPQPPYDENDLQHWNWFYEMYADFFFPTGITLRRHYSDVPENNEETSFCSVYPNPVNDCIRIELSDNASCQSVTIYSIDGRLVFETQDATAQPTTINVANLKSGVYIIKVKLTDGNAYVAKIVKK